MKKHDQHVPAIPESDVSTAVGLSGLLGLFIWVTIARAWPYIAEAFALPGPRAVLSGPYAALTTMFFTGIPMVLVSIFHDKVHLRPSTGIDWNKPRSKADALEFSITKLAGLWATWALIAFYYCVGRWYWDGQYLFAMHVIGAFAVPMFILSIPYVIWLDRRLIDPRDGCWHFGAMLVGREAYDWEQIKKHGRAWAVKAFFCAFMFSIMPPNYQVVVDTNITEAIHDPAKFSLALIYLCFLVDVHCAMVGYLLTMKPLDAHIRSANPHLAGWLSALLCYPPFALMVSKGPLDYQQGLGEWQYWMQGHTSLMWFWGILVLMLTAIYAWATVIFGIRFSNLTYRGVITNGPYRYTRHPAYLAKNTFWWLATPPLIAVSHSLTDAIRNTTMLALISAIYYWRAKTEEKHLLAEDPKYREYYDWMNEHGVITSRLVAIGRFLRQRSGAQVQPAE